MYNDTGLLEGDFMFKDYMSALKQEFHGYNVQTLMQDLLAGLTVAAVALPLALAFGVSSGADAGAGLITAIIAGLVIGVLSGASYQISGPTGAMSAILIGLSTTYGLQGVFIASFLSGCMLIIASLFKFGKIVSFIPTSVITGFTSGIAIIIALGQIDNFFGTTSVGSSALEKLFSYTKLGFPISLPTVFFGALVVVIMILWPKKWGEYCPSSLAGIIIALICQLFLNLPVHEVGTIPSTLFPEARLSLSAIHLSTLTQLMLPALSIAALGMIESLLCGASAGKMKNEKLNADQELMAQGIGNMLIPLFGGVPATAAIARTSVAIKAGGKTRLVSVFHSVVILISMFLLGSLMSRIPLSALAGVLMVTAWRMNDWHEIKTLFHNKVKTNISQYLITMCATVVFDLTVAIVIGVMVSIILFVLNNSHLHIDIRDIDKDRVGKDLKHHHQKTRIMYLSGPIFFGTQEQMTQVLDEIDDSLEAIIFSMRGVPSIDDSGIHEFFDIVDRLQSNNCKIKFSGVQEEVMTQFKRNHFDEYVGKDSFCWDAIMALESLDKELLIND